MKKTIKDIEVKGKRVLVRCDFNVPLKEGRITDDIRIVSALPTINYLREHGARVILMSHLGRPEGEPKKEFTLAPVAERLTELLGEKVIFAASDLVVDEKVKEAANALKDGEVNTDDFKDLTESFKNSLKNTSIAVKAEKFKSADVPAIINVSEFTRRFSEMNAFYGLAGGDADRDMTIILNTENPVVASFTGLNDEMKKFVANQIYYIAMLSYKKLNPEELKDFSDNSMQLLKNYIG